MMSAGATVLVIAFSGVSLAAKSAQPGDQLWGLTEVLYSDYARSVETAAWVRTELEHAKKALQEEVNRLTQGLWPGAALVTAVSRAAAPSPFWMQTAVIWP